MQAIVSIRFTGRFYDPDNIPGGNDLAFGRDLRNPTFGHIVVCQSIGRVKPTPINAQLVGHPVQIIDTVGNTNQVPFSITEVFH